MAILVGNMKQEIITILKYTNINELVQNCGSNIVKMYRALPQSLKFFSQN